MKFRILGLFPSVYGKNQFYRKNTLANNPFYVCCMHENIFFFNYSKNIRSKAISNGIMQTPNCSKILRKNTEFRKNNSNQKIIVISLFGNEIIKG